MNVSEGDDGFSVSVDAPAFSASPTRRPSGDAVEKLQRQVAEARAALEAGVASQEEEEARLVAELDSLMPQLRAAAMREGEDARAWAALQTARQALSVEADVDAAAASSKLHGLAPETAMRVWSVVAYWEAHQSLDAAAALRKWAEFAGIVSVAELTTLGLPAPKLSGRFVTREDADLLTDNAARREAEMATEVQRLKQRLAVATLSESHLKERLKELSADHDLAQAANRRLSAQARVSPISKGAVLAPAPGTPSTPGMAGSVGGSADGEPDEVAMELAATRREAARHKERKEALSVTVTSLKATVKQKEKEIDALKAQVREGGGAEAKYSQGGGALSDAAKSEAGRGGRRRAAAL